MLKGHFLDPGHARVQFDAFRALPGSSGIPLAVCYKLSEFAQFYMAANEMFQNMNVPENERGIALVVGVHKDAGSSHANNKPTVMMVATQWVDDGDPKAGKVASINNPFIKGGWAALVDPPEIGDVAYDAGSLWP